MKRMLKFISIACLVLAGVLFLYGGIKMTEAEDQSPQGIEMGDGIQMVRKSQAENFSEKAFNMSTLFGIGGVVLFLFSRGIKD